MRIVGNIDEMHGVLGQTLRWTPADAAAKVVDGDLAEAPEAFEVADGLLGSRFKYSRFSHALPAAAAGKGDTKADEPLLSSARSDALPKQQAKKEGAAVPSGVATSRRLLAIGGGGGGGRALLVVPQRGRGAAEAEVKGPLPQPPLPRGTRRS